MSIYIVILYCIAMVVICNGAYPETKEEHFATFSFPLSDFQKWAIEAIVEGHHTLVTAHTGSGKTVPAEFAIRHFVKTAGKRVIYTSPIKALSNQKYAEFSRKFPDITFGLMTGDIKTNPDADVLIMTTEILMNSLFLSESESKENSQQQQPLQFQMDYHTELGCVVFDEVHYINDADRGQTWENTILMLPLHIQMVMLSATIDAPERFAQWIENRENQTPDKKRVYLCSTNERVVPLSHYGFMTVGEGSIKLLKDKALEKEVRDNTQKLVPLQTAGGKFLEEGYKTLKRTAEIVEKHGINHGHSYTTKRRHALNQLALFLRDREMLPAIAFVFSRKQVESCAREITVPLLEDDSKVPYTIARECEQMVRRLPNAHEYLELPEYTSLVKLLEKGIAIHHSGMIPILREIVECMISKKYVKMLFATESFAIGLDCPIRTAVFTSLTKFDGNHQRYLHPHEYTQMAGRAGRRGIDTIGYVVHCNDLFSLPSANEYKATLCGKPQSLVSKFRITPRLLLHLLQKTGDQTTFEGMVEFAQKSMCMEEIQTTKTAAIQFAAMAEKSFYKTKEKMQYLRTPETACREYLDAEGKVKGAVNKKRKELERTLAQLRQDHRYIAEDAAKWVELAEKEEKMEETREYVRYLADYIQNEVLLQINVLRDRGFLETMVNPFQNGSKKALSYKLTRPLGEMAAQLAEIHPLVLSHWILEWGWFRNFSPTQIVGVLACFVDIRLEKEEDRHSVPFTRDNWLKSRIEEIRQSYEELELVDEIQFDMTDAVMDWVDCEDEYSCKAFIQGKIGGEMGVSVGDWTKAMLKMAVIVQELVAISESQFQVECAHKLSQIPAMILKYVTTAQSLYV